MRLILALPLLALVLACTTGDNNAYYPVRRLRPGWNPLSRRWRVSKPFQVTAVADFGEQGDDLRAHPMR